MHHMYNIPANCLDFIRTVLIFDFHNLQKSGRPDFLKFQLVNTAVLEVMLKTFISQYFSRFFLCKLRRNFLYPSEPYSEE